MTTQVCNLIVHISIVFNFESIFDFISFMAHNFVTFLFPLIICSHAHTLLYVATIYLQLYHHALAFTYFTYCHNHICICHFQCSMCTLGNSLNVLKHTWMQLDILGYRSHIMSDAIGNGIIKETSMYKH